MSGVEVVRAPVESDDRELDRRSGDGIEVVLVWEPRTDRVAVVVVDERTSVQFRVEVDPARALDAFYHPFAYESECAHDPCVAV